MNPRDKYISKACDIVRPYHSMPGTVVLVASSVLATGRHGAWSRRRAFEEIGYPKKRKPSLPDKSNLHPIFNDILAAVAPGVTR